MPLYLRQFNKDIVEIMGFYKLVREKDKKESDH